MQCAQTMFQLQWIRMFMIPSRLSICTVFSQTFHTTTRQYKKGHAKHINTNIHSIQRCNSRNFHRILHLCKDEGYTGVLDAWDVDGSAQNIIDDKLYRDEDYILPESGHDVFIILPDLKKPTLTRPELQLNEACALVDTLPQWTVAHKLICRLRSTGSRHLFGKGNFEMLSREIKKRPFISAVFISIDMLSGLQLATLQDAWKVPVYDRYTIVLQIFKIHARTKEAKLQVALAEVPYLRSRLRGMHQGTLDQQRGGLNLVGGSGETYMELRRRILEEREQHIKKVLAGLKKKREFVRANRIKNELPIVAVVGYTNAGKTSLIKALTKESSMLPRNQLFATLDVTAHAGQLPSHMTVLFIDTVGFISDIPIDLIESFSATLEDAVHSDVIVHVRDISHPDTKAQKAKVIETLKSLHISEKLLNSVIEVGNKVDLLHADEVPSHSEIICISAIKETGLGVLAMEIEETMIENTDRINKLFKIPMDKEHLRWLYKEGTVVSTESIESDEQSLLVKVILTKAAYGKFKARFAK